ncbi:PDZ domain-containing protein 7-like isoform X2 [Littorina saxatilis]|uniref:PDZ domain-containing protein 7-like isoform X2 n=1 Tax=Littorina saxatilis TaxID=31220 RepID=UPI0038B43BF8
MDSRGGGGKADFFTTFHQLCVKLLTAQERSALHNSLQTYQTSRNVTSLVSRTRGLWTSQRKLQLLPFVRSVIAVTDRQQFDALLGVHEGLVVRGPRSSKASSMSSTRSGNHPAGRRADTHVVKIRPSASPRMGFSIRGGSEYGLGVFVSVVEPGSSAEAAGLKTGDQILEANAVDLKKASSKRAADVLSSSAKHTLVVRRTRKVPEWKVTKERVLWYDVATRKLVAAPTGELSAVKQTPDAEEREVKERKVVLRITRDTDFVGLNVRGGKEFGLGIYISRVDKGGVAERGGVEVGDQLVQINEHKLDNVPHDTAVDLLRDGNHLVLTLWAVGRFPAYKEVFSEYVWSDGSDKANGGSLLHSAELHPQPRVIPIRQRGRVRHRTKTRESRVDRSPRDSGIDLHHPLPDYDDHHDLDDDEEEDLEEGFPVHAELFYPRDQDIIFRGNYTENWRDLDRAYGGADTASTATANSERRGSSATYGSKSLSGVGSDSDSSDAEMDYTTFLERKTRRDEERQAAREEAARHVRTTGQHKAESSRMEREEPAHQGRTARQHETESSGMTREEPAHRGRTVVMKSRTENSTVTARVEPTPMSSTQQVVRVEPRLVKTTDRTEHNEERLRNRLQDLHATDSVREDFDHYSEVDMVTTESRSRQPSGSSSMHIQHPDSNDIYAVVRKPPRRQPPKGGEEAKTTTNGSRPHHDARSNSSGSSGSESGMGRHHRTHIYHINASPTTNRRGGGRGDDEEEDDYVVVAEVMEEVATRDPSPPADYRRPSLASDVSSDSNSGSTVTDPLPRHTGGGREGGGGGAGESPTASELLSQEIRRLETRKSNIGSREILQLTEPAPDRQDREQEKAVKGAEEGKKGGTWSAIKKKLTGSFRGKKGSSFSMGSVRKKGIFERSFGSQMMNQLTVDKYNLMMLEERARGLLRKDESEAVLRHIKNYHDNKDLDRLVSVLLVILDKPEKLQLLKDIRGVVFPIHVGRFDRLVAQHEVSAFDKTSSKLHLPLSPVHRSDSHVKPRTKLMTTVLDTDGHFHIQSVAQEDLDTERQSRAVTAMHQTHETPNSRPHDHHGTAPSNHSDCRSDGMMKNNINNNNNYKDHRNDRRGRQPSNADMPLPPPPEWRDDIEVIIIEKEPAPRPRTPPAPEEGFVVYVSKQKKNIGLIVCGGAGDHRDRSVRIEMVMPWGACADDERIQSGMHILSVDDQSVQGLTQAEAIALLKRCFTDPKSVNMKLRLKQP